MITQTALTKIFLEQWGKSSDEINVKLYGRKWWQSTRIGKSSLRLTEHGFDFLKNILNLTSYEIPFTDKIELSPQTIIFLERYLDCPYFLTHKTITVFDERRCVELYFFSDDMRRYGLAKAMKARQYNL